MSERAPGRMDGLSAEKQALLVLQMRKKKAAEAAARAASAPALSSIPPRAVSASSASSASSGPAPLSFAQQRFWLLDRLEPGTTAYNIPMGQRLRGPLDVAALKEALAEIVRRHEALRTTFTEVEGEPVQMVAPPGGLALLLADLSGLPAAPREAERTRLVDTVARPFDLQAGPLFRATLVRLAAEDHLLLLDVHHIAADGWSFGVIFRELAELYGAFRARGAAPLPPLAIQYADFAVWQRGRLRGEVLEEQLSWWRERLAGAPPVLDLPLDRVRPAAQGYRGAKIRAELPAALSDRLRVMSLKEGVTPFMTLLAAFQLLLSRLAGQDDVVVGAPSAGRTRPEVEGLVGLFLNTLVLRTDLAGDPTFRELLGRVRDTVLGAYRYQEIPFERLLEELKPERQLSRTPIFQVLFNFISVSGLHMGLPGLEVEPVESERVDSKFDFTLYVEERLQSFRFELVYDTDLFEPGRMREMLRQLTHLLEQAVAAPGSRIGALSLVTPGAPLPDPERPLSAAWHGPAHDALSREAAAHPERPAVQDARGTSWTFAELEARANRLGRFLVSHGIGNGDAVAVWAHRSAPLVQALLGTHKAGASFLILDPSYPAPRVLDYLGIVRPAAWIAVAGAPPEPPEVAAASASCLRVDLASDALSSMPGISPDVSVGQDDAACITFTSGSTGVPKGVVGLHGALTHFYPWMGERFGLGPDDRFGVLSALSHDPLQRDVLTPIWFGARMVLPDPDRIGMPGYLAEWLRSERVTVVNLTPALLEMVLDSAGGELPDLRLVFVVGDLLRKGQVERLQRLAPAVECVNLYGATETQRALSFFVVPRGRDLERPGKEVLPLGQGMEGCQLLVLNRSERLAGVGEVGEIHVRSRHLARGYLDDPVLTAERFLPGPLAGDRLYRTGDLGRYLPDGGVEMVGRADFQVKLRGFRIELGEVEAALSRHPGVRECVVIVREDRPGDRRLVGYLVADDPPLDLRAFLGSRLPDFMVPSAFVILPALPRTRTGKVDRLALPAPAEDRSEAPAVGRSPVEELLAGIWADLLGRPDVASHENFFDLGGHSLLATRMISRLRSVLGLELPLRALFERPTLAGFAALVEQARRGGEASEATPILRLPRGGPLPTSFSQQRLWFLDRLEPGGFAYNLGGALRLEGDLDVAALAGALGAITRRHETLRTRFAEVDGEAWQIVDEPSERALPVVDLSGLSAAACAGEKHRLAIAELRRPYDLARGPLARFAVLRLGEREHVLLLGMHHIVSDGWSMGILVRELRVLYGGGDPLPDLPVQYADHAAWQRQRLSGEALETTLSWWKRHLSGAPQVVELPLDRPRPAVQSYRGGRAYRAIGSSLPARSVALMGATPFMTLLAGFATLLSRYSGLADVVVGTPIANRGRAELEDLIGFFANTLALRVDLSGDPGFDELVRRVREVSLEAYTHQDVPFERLVSELRPERDLSHAPVFQVMLALQNLPESRMDLAGLELSPVEVDFERTQYDLSLFLFPDEGGLSARLEYASDLFDAATAQRILGHFEVLLAGVTEHPGAPLSRLPLLTAAEIGQLAAWDETVRHPVGLLHELFEEQAGRTPEAVALVAGETRLTYAELEARSAELASTLRAMGAGPEVGVAVCLERTADLIITMLAVLRAGSFYVPIDPRYPEERRAFLVEDSGARIVVGPHPPAPSPPPPFTPAPGEGETCLGPGNLAYLIYTSGSTGRPKAVAISHASAVVFAHWARTAFSPDELRGVLASTAVTFDLSVFEIFVTLAWGGTVVLVEDALALLSGPPAAEITLVNTVPSAMAELLRENALPSSVRTINLAGEALPRWLVDRAYARPETERVCNLYGPSEDTTYSTWVVVDRSSERTPSIGRPVDGTQAYVLDPGLERLPVGVPGELYLAGSGLARGYLGRPELTAERFLPDRFAVETGGRMYRTGDLVRLRPDGKLEYLGRLDHQVKIRGFRIELGEVEAALSRQSGVEAAVVVARENRLVAYVVGGASAGELRQSLQRELPDAMVPSGFVFLESFPLTPHGKVDRKALPASDQERPDTVLGERSPIEELLAGIWADLLGVFPIALDESFFELGGHSLLATRLVSRVRAVLGVEVPLRTVFEEPTLAGFAARVERLRRAGAGLEAPPLVRVPGGGLLPASFAQQRLWFLDRLDPESSAYNLALAVRMTGSLDVAALAAALDEIVRRHEVLRTVFVEEAGEPWQVVLEPTAVPLSLVDLSGLPEGFREGEMRRVAGRENRRPYDLSRGPLLRAVLLRLEDRVHALWVGMHHIVSDGWSLGIFLRELGTLYRRPATLPELPIQYANHASWQRRWLNGPVMEERIGWWKARLADAPQVVDLPLDRPRPSVQTHRGGRVDVTLGVDLPAQRLGVTPFMVLLSCFAALLSRYGGQSDVVVGTPIANRDRAELEGLIGIFVNTLALRVDLSGDPGFGELAHRVREMSLDAYARQDVPFERLVDALRPERSLSHSPVFQVMLAFQNLPNASGTGLDLEGLTLSPLDLDGGRTHYDLSLFVHPMADGTLLARMRYAADLFDAATVERLLGHLQVLLQAADGNPETPLSLLPLLTAAEQAQLAAWDETAQHPAGLLHELFEEQARRTPGAVALVAGETTLTYADLEARSADLARTLREMGAGPEVGVAVCLERTAELIVTLLAVLRSGSFYVPIDPRYPEERRAFLIEDSGARIVVDSGRVEAPSPAQQGRVGEGSSPDPANLAYLIYTSGSTGRPKAVAVTHASAVVFAHWARAAFSPDELRGVLASTAVTFDLSVFEIFVTLAWRGTVVLVEDALALLSGPPAAEITLVNTVPSAMAELLRENALPPSVRTINLAGEALPRWLVDQAYARPETEKVCNLYGPSEDTTYSTWTVVDRSSERAPIGRPVDGTRAYVLDRGLERLPVGVPGELYLAGAGLARGYLGRPELTAERFLPDRFAVDSGGRMYRTGDLVRLRSDGELEYLGRLDHQVKIRGFRIELGEVEAALSRQPGVEAAVVVARDNRLVAYLVGGSVMELRQSLQRELPDAMVPSAFVLLESLPLTAHGKVDREALPAPELERKETVVGERSPIEDLLAGIWSELLGVSPIASDESFFDLGGHSLLATRMVSRVRAVLGVEVPLRALFEEPTVAGFAARVEQQRSAGAEVPQLVRVPRGGPLPASFSQRRLWFLDRLDPESSAYHLTIAASLAGVLDVPALARALGGIVRRHEALRTVFTDQGGEPWQVILEPAPPSLPLVDLAGLPEDARGRETRRVAADWHGRRYDLSRGPLLRPVLLRLNGLEHALLAGMHHIVSDGWSLGIFLRELGELYRRPDGLPDLPVQYADYASWQRLSEQALEERLVWWKERLADAPQLVDLPLDRPRPSVQTYRGSRVDVTLGIELPVRRLGVTPFMALLAGFAALLSRYGGQEDVVVGTPVANRGRAELEGLIGMFVNTLALRVDLLGDPGFDELARRVREMSLEAYARQDVPFERLVDELRPDRSLSHSPVFQVMLAFQNLPEVGLDLEGLRLSPLALESGRTQYDLSLFIHPLADRLLARMTYASDLFDAATAERILGHLEVMLEGAVESPETPLSRLPLLTPAEIGQLAGWDETVRHPAGLLHELFEEQARRVPEAVALVAGETRLTYAELEARSAEMARTLRAMGAGPEVGVAVCLERTADLVVTLLAVLRSGSFYVPIDPRYPEERRSFLIEDSGARIVIDLGWAGAPSPAQQGRVREGSSPEPSNLAYLIYTSGSTGRPKAVAITHASAVVFAHWARTAFSPDELRGVLASTAVTFDLSVFEIFVTLAWGGTVVLVDDALALLSGTPRHEITLINTVPSAMAELLREEALPKSVRTINLAGEALPRWLVDRAYARPETERVCNLYGPSEDTTYSTWTVVEWSSERAPSIGRPVDGTRAYVLDRGLERLPVGVPGELYLAGAGLARGYLGRPELTAERFLPDLFATESGGRMYRTGDLVRLRPDGELEYLGRLDHQVKIRGFRIELGEVEAALSRQPGVEAAVVVARDNRLVAYLVGGSVSELRQALQRELPDAMVPSAFVLLESFPLTPHGKVDRKALPAPEQDRREAVVGERSPVEELLAGIWSELLGVSPIASDESFFELGGHSLLATRMVSRVRSVLGVEIPLRAVFEEPTLAGFAARVERQRQAGAGLEAAPLVRVPRGGLLPASFAQQRLWFLDRLDPESSAYNLALAVRLAGSLDVAALAGALDAIVRRHEALRTVFVEEAGEPWQVVLEPVAVSLPLVDLSGLPDDLRERELRRVVAGESRRRYDLSRGPLLRSALLRLEGREHALWVGMHHIVSDGWSLVIFLRELGELYRQPAALPELPIQYADYASWQWLNRQLLDEKLGWWKSRLADATQLVDLPLDRPRPSVQTYRGGRVDMTLGSELPARHLGVTPFMALLSGFAALLSRYGGQGDVVVGTPIANRGRAELEGLIGMFVNTLALRVDLSGDPGFAELARRVREMSLDAYARQDVPFERLVDELRPDRSLSHSPVFQVMLAFQNLPEVGLDLEGLTLSPLALESDRTQYDLSLFVHPLGDELFARMTYATDLFDATTAERILGHFQVLLEGVSENPETPLSRLPLLTPAEIGQLAAWDETVRHPAGLLHELFEEQAGRTPEAVALVAGETTLTYTELEARSAELARTLRAMGAGPEVGVAVCLERTADLVVTLLGILRAGSFYVPIDPRYPEERQAFLIEDSGAQIIVGPGWAGAPSPAQQGRVREGSSPEPSNLAYLIYTSGSTGRPKAVAITHASAVVFAHWARTAFSPEELRGVLASTAVTFDLSVFEIFVTLAWGGTVVLVEDALALLSRAPKPEITLINTVPSAMAELLREDALPSSVRTINLAGEALPRWLVDRAYARPETERVCNLYGPSEDTTYSTWTVVERDTDRAPSIGRPVDGSRAYVLDRGLERLPVGVPGELYLAGAGLARGYLGRPELTAERFLPDRFAVDPEVGPGGRMYRTGDLVRLRSDGELEYLGRLDHQVKIRGFRIELGEVEAALSRQPGVEGAVVVARDNRLVAYIVGGGSDLRQALQRELPDAMVPSAFVLLESFPLTPHGKVDHKALPAPEQDRRETVVGERSPVEELLAGIWSELLGVSPIASAESFFELGGHSLLATRMVSRVRAVLGVEVPLRAVFEEPTLAGFAALFEGARQADAPVVPPLVSVPRSGPLPSSFSQRRLWFLSRLDPGSAAYNLAGGVRLEGALDVPALSGALSAIVRRHEALRTVFVEDAGEPWQVVMEPVPLPLPVIDLATLPEDRREEELRRIAAGDAGRPYDLAQGPLVRSTLLRLGAREHALILGMHHIVSDGWSLSLFVRELSDLYRGRSLPALPIQYADYAAWQRGWLSEEVLRERLAWWTQRLAGAPPLVSLPLDRPRPGVQSTRGDHVVLTIRPEPATRFESLARRLGVTPFMALLAGFAALLSRYGDQEDVVVGTPIANRGRAELEELIGFFVNTLALRVDLAGDPTFGELARRAREMSLGAYAHQDVPFERLVDELRPERSLSHSPIFQVVLALQNLPPGGLDLAGLTLSPLEIESGRTQYDLSLFLVPLPDSGGLRARLHFASDLFEAATARRLLGHFRRLLEGVGEELRLSELPLLDDAEREQVLTAWNRTTMEIPDEPVHRLVFQWAERTPDARAVVWDGGSLTYGELACRAREMAERMRGVGPETVVALQLDRSADLIVSALAVLEAGGAYLPIDPSWPEERKSWILEDSRALSPTGEGRGGGLPDSLAYVIYTSGSTGRPKGTELGHRGLSNLTAWHRRAYGLEPGDRTALLASPGFDASIWETWAPLTAGAEVHIPARDVVLSPPALLRWMVERGITVAFLPTPLAETVLVEPMPPNLLLRALLTGGDRLSRRPPEGLPFVLVNHYGPTESTVVATAGPVATAGERAPDIGQPIANTRVYILDRWQQPVPVGAAGELCLAGEGLARGYRGRPELTAERFVPNPLGDGARLYRTGDLARRLASGEIEFLGRIDHQVKIRGHRIELGEIEVELAALPDVQTCVVVARPDALGENRLVAYVVPRPGSVLEVSRLRSLLESRLPGAMIPAVFVVLAALPLDPNGKIDRRALPEPAAPEQADFTPPRNPLEEEVARIWCEVLGVERVGVDDSFWDLGGHSLLATRTLARLADTFGVEVPLQTLFMAPTLGAFSSALGEAVLAGLSDDEMDSVLELEEEGS